MNNTDENGLFVSLCHGINNINELSLPKVGTLFAFVINGECVMRSRSLAATYQKGAFFVRALSGNVELSGEAKLAYAVLDGSLYSQICAVSSVLDGFHVTAGGLGEDVFRLCELLSDDEAVTDAAFVFHRLIRNAAVAKRDESLRRVDTAVLIKEYIDSHAAGRLSLEEIAKVFFISKTQIFRIYKKCFGISPMQYYLQKKIDVSKKLLVEDNMRVCDIAETLGFSDPKHYSKTFKRFVGKLPRDYKREKRAHTLNRLMVEDDE